MKTYKMWQGRCWWSTIITATKTPKPRAKIREFQNATTAACKLIMMSVDEDWTIVGWQICPSTQPETLWQPGKQLRQDLTFSFDHTHTHTHLSSFGLLNLGNFPLLAFDLRSWLRRIIGKTQYTLHIHET